MRALPTPSTNDGPRFHMNIPISELIEHDTRAIEASVVNIAPPVVKTKDRVTHESRPTPTEPHTAQGLKPPDPNSGIHPTRVRRLAHEGLEAASCQIEPGEKT